MQVHQSPGSQSDERGIGQIKYEIDPMEEKKLLRSLDLRLVPVVMLVYMFSFLDRYVLSHSATSTWLAPSPFPNAKIEVPVSTLEMHGSIIWKRTSV